MKWVWIEWEDAQCLAPEVWNDRQEWEYVPCLCQSVGFILYDGPEGLIITDSHNKHQTGHVQQIPKGMIKRCQTYEVE